MLVAELLPGGAGGEGERGSTHPTAWEYCGKANGESARVAGILWGEHGEEHPRAA